MSCREVAWSSRSEKAKPAERPYLYVHFTCLIFYTFYKSIRLIPFLTSTPRARPGGPSFLFLPQFRSLDTSKPGLAFLPSSIILPRRRPRPHHPHIVTCRLDCRLAVPCIEGAAGRSQTQRASAVDFRRLAPHLLPLQPATRWT